MAMGDGLMQSAIEPRGGQLKRLEGSVTLLLSFPRTIPHVGWR
jgi:hypothetical protein